MVDYLYDGSFEGFLCCVYAHYYEEKASGVFQKEQYQPSMLNAFREVPREEEKAVRVYEAIGDKISPFDLRRVYSAFLSKDEEKEMKILRYLILGFKEGPRTSMLHGNPVVFAVQRLEGEVTREVHRLKGLVRFTELKGGVLYAPIDPDHDVTERLAGHFNDRFKNDPFIIHDQTRSKALFAAGGDWYISDFDKSALPPLSESEEQCRRLWKKYFDTIAIKERTNPRCQKNFMPVRYWKNLTEKL